MDYTQKLVDLEKELANYEAITSLIARYKQAITEFETLTLYSGIPDSAKDVALLNVERVKRDLDRVMAEFGNCNA